MAELPGSPSPEERAGSRTESSIDGESWGWLLVPFAVSLAVLAVLGPDVVFRTSVPARTDLPGHLLPPHLLAEELLPRFRIRGWSPEWFAGFPLYWFYFPLPGWIAAALGTVTGPVVALRVVALAPAFALPWVLFAWCRWSGLPSRVTAATVVVGSSFLLTTHSYLLGGNLLSLLTGEFAYGWGLCLTVLYLGSLARARADGSAGLLPGLVLSAAVLSHVVPTLVGMIAAAILLLVPGVRRTVVGSWIVAGLLTAFWTLPLAANLDQVAHLAWSFRPGWNDLLPVEVLLLLPAALAAVPLIVRRRGPALLVAAGAAALLVTWIPQSLVMQGRALPVWYLGLHVAAGMGLGHAWRTLRRRPAAPRVLALTVGGGLWISVLAIRGIEPVRTFSADVLGGIPERPGADELDGLLERLRELPPGRVHWEDGDGLDRWGGPHVLALIPYWTSHSSLGGLLAESSPTSEAIRVVDQLLSADPREHDDRPFPELVPWNPTRAAAVLRQLGVRYLVTISGQTAQRLFDDPTIVRLGQFGQLVLFDLGPAAMVTPLTCTTNLRVVPNVRAAYDAWISSILTSRTPSRAEWIVQGDEHLFRADTCAADSSGVVENVEIGRERLTFRTTAIGIPHLVRVSYFPYWGAQGAVGPYPGAPWLMIVLPTRQEVALEFHTGAWGKIGWALTLLGFAVVALGSVVSPVGERHDPMRSD